MVVPGTLIYNEIWVIPCCGFDRNTKAARLERVNEGLDASYKSLHSTYQSMSPRGATLTQ